MTEVLEQTDEEAAAEAKAAIEADQEAARLAEQDAEADARAAKAAELAAEQDALDNEDRQTPDRPEGAADDDSPEDEESLAEQLRKQSGLAGDHAEARGEEPPASELPGMPERKLTSNAGGEKPTGSEFKLNGKALELGASTEFKKGTRTRIVLDVEWGTVAFIDKHDKETGQITDTIRRHTGKIVSYELEDVA